MSINFIINELEKNKTYLRTNPNQLSIISRLSKNKLRSFRNPSSNFYQPVLKINESPKITDEDKIYDYQEEYFW